MPRAADVLHLAALAGRKISGTGPIRSRLAAFAGLLVAASMAFGQVAPKRLSDWLLEQPASADAYPLGLSWRVPEEKAPQMLLRRDLLSSLTGFEREVAADPVSVARLREWLETLPVTGRVPVPLADARWLQANVARDPIIEPHHTVLLPARPRTVTVVRESGERCAVTHRYGYEARAYIEACEPELSQRADRAWIAQPDGRIQSFGIATWNRETQDEPAPGAWIWAPSRGSGWPEIFSERLVRFLATQGPAADLSGATAGAEPARAPAPSRSSGVTASDWGPIGLLQMPSARLSKPGTFNFTLSHVQPYSRINFFVTPLDWLEAGFRYSDISNRLYDPTGALSSQSAKDKGFDVKFKLWDEAALLPQVSIGFRDLAGTGAFSGEYVVASKRTDAFDWTLGLGWGYVGGRGNLRNPLSAIFGSKFDTRQPLSPEGGTPLFGSYFRGPTALFGGVQYQTPWEPLFLKLEYDGNDYQHEPFANNNQTQKSPWNLGLVYRGRWADLSLAWERGNKLMVGLTVFVDLPEGSMPKLSDPPRVPTVIGRGAGTRDWKATSDEITRQSSWYVERVELRGRELHVTLDDAGGQHWRERLDRVAAVLNRDAPPSVDRFVLLYRQRGIDVAEHVIDRDAWVSERSRFLPPGEQRGWVIARPPNSEPMQRTQIPPYIGLESRAPDERASGAIRTLYERPQQRFDWNLGLDFTQTIGGPDTFALYSFHGALRSALRITDDTWARAIFRLRLLDNYDKFTVTGPSNLPRVRTFLREYLTTSQFTMPVLQVTHASQLTQNQYYSLYAGYFEEMFGGLGAEWLYRPFASRFAFGAEVAALKQRSFEQDFGFRDYNVISGHATGYWDTGWNELQVKLIAGRYLAKDIGVTLDVSRVFKNGITVGAFATKTNVSSAEFGEGSFDKGVYMSIPFDVMMTRSSTSTAYLLWKPITRDGGAILNRIDRLYGLTRLRDEKTLWYAPAAPRNESVKPEDQREAWTPRPEGPQPWTRVETRPTVKQWEDDARFEHELTRALYQQRFRNIEVVFDSAYRLNIKAANESLRPISRAVGRAVRTAIRFAPLETREIRVTFAEKADPVVVYEFTDTTRLQAYMAGQLGREAFADTVAVRYLDPTVREADPLARFGDLDTLDDTPKIANALPDGRTLKRVTDDVQSTGQVAASADWWRFTTLSVGALAAGAALDKRAFNYASEHADSSVLKGLSNVANALPWVALGGATLAAIDGSDPRRSRTGYAAAEAGVTAGLAATVLKYAVGRARPDSGLGTTSFDPGSTASDHGSFPSRHVAVAWAVATPFAREYNADWLYGVAALTNLGRIGSRAHWVSDTVGGSLLGYAIGRLFWEASRKPQSQGIPRVLLNPTGVSLAWELE
jgi:membrane-associated phospholipid phosphatase